MGERECQKRLGLPNLEPYYIAPNSNEATKNLYCMKASDLIQIIKKPSLHRFYYSAGLCGITKE